MADAKVAPYGSWKSPITADLIATETLRLGQLAIDGEDVYWVETRPIEGGRNVIVKHTPDGQTRDITPAPFNVRTRVHEYGGGDFVVKDGTIYFSNFTDQRLYRQDPETLPQPITPEADLRYADGTIDSDRKCLICVREAHVADGREAVNTLVSVRLGDVNEGRVVVSGNDFYASPRLSPDGARLAWLTWNHPNMPWDGTELWVGELKVDGALTNIRQVVGGVDESIFQPEWSPAGTLHFVSDRTGWWNLYRYCEDSVEPLYEMEAEFGCPQWGLGMSTYGFVSSSRIICSYTQDGVWHLATLDTTRQTLEPIETTYSSIPRPRLKTFPSGAVLSAGSPTEPLSVVRFDSTSTRFTTLRRSSQITIEDRYVSIPEPIEFLTSYGRTAHGFFYRPCNRDYHGPSDERPPLLVMSHGGPTGATSTALSLELQYWTSRGIAVLDVNYGGSTGYGRAYRQRLDGEWGIVDVDDCVNGALYLVAYGEVDGNRLAIRGGSAGGYTTLCALTFRDTFKAGASYYGISDLEAMAKDTHKFESRYLDRLVGPYPAQRDLYRNRSPIHFVSRLSCPLILFQGLEDKVVPPNQAELMVQSLRDRGLPVSYIPFEGEQHGFRRSENVQRSLESELSFYAQVFGFAPPDAIVPVEIENLKNRNR